MKNGNEWGGLIQWGPTRLQSAAVAERVQWFLRSDGSNSHSRERLAINSTSRSRPEKETYKSKKKKTWPKKPDLSTNRVREIFSVQEFSSLLSTVCFDCILHHVKIYITWTSKYNTCNTVDGYFTLPLNISAYNTYIYIHNIIIS